MKYKSSILGIVLLIAVIGGLGLILDQVREIGVQQGMNGDITSTMPHIELCSANTANNADRLYCEEQFEKAESIQSCFFLFKHQDDDKILDSSDLTEFRQNCLFELDY